MESMKCHEACKCRGKLRKWLAEKTTNLTQSVTSSTITIFLAPSVLSFGSTIRLCLLHHLAHGTAAALKRECWAEELLFLKNIGWAKHDQSHHLINSSSCPLLLLLSKDSGLRRHRGAQHSRFRAAAVPRVCESELEKV
eukprot:scaffold233_cov174-Ochromonas_danica.AAC.39